MKQLYKMRLPADVISFKKVASYFLYPLIDFENSSAGHRKVMLRHQNTNIVTSL